ncbi:hypothetical protein [Streptomyces acidicola]|uniref:hypothetical protein n=1 Tax=Streptomyces acidicola TaxID=2596892 RepID=UPI003805B7BE
MRQRSRARRDADIEDRAHVLRADIHTAGLTYAELTLDLALAFHHAARGAQEGVTVRPGQNRSKGRAKNVTYHPGE